MKPDFVPIETPPGLQIRDPIENAQFELYTSRRVDPTPADTEQFVFPVDSAMAIATDEIEIPRLVDVFLRGEDAGLVGESANQQRVEYGDDWYSLNVDVGPMKLQILAEGAVAIRRSENSTYLEFERPSTVTIGVRSLHESPAATITVGDDVEDGMRAVSLFGSALKTTSPERSFPTLRGHPPLVERGDGFQAPDALTKPETDVRVEIPRNWGALYTVSSLAYYLGADVVPGTQPVLAVGGERYSLATDRDFQTEVNSLLKHVFLLDCVTRTVGFYPVNLAEARAIEDDLPFTLEDAYDAGLVERLQSYLAVPFDVTEPHWPRWKLTADVADDDRAIESMPFAVNELAEVRVQGDEEQPPVHEEPDAVTDFYRAGGAPTRSASEPSVDYSNVVKPPETDSIEHVWLADGFPLGASKTTAEWYRRRLDDPVKESGAIAIHIVCNDPGMSDEDIVEEFYGARDFFEFDINVHYDLTKSELSDLLVRDTDFLHYIGHVDDGGFQCEDGMLDAHTLEEVNVEAFLLNACQSYEQGAALVDRGSRGGIVTLSNISNDPAVRIGRALARLLNNGFSLQAALSVARNVTIFGSQYITIGDGTLQLVQSISGTPVLAEVEQSGEGFSLTIHGYPTSRSSIGSLYTPHITENTTRYLNSGVIDSFEVSLSELRNFLSIGVGPVLYEDSLVWSDELLENELS